MIEISLVPEPLASGTSEERATFGLFSLMVNDRLLAAGRDTNSRELRDGPYVAGYPLAEWLVWNWWRLRWELSYSSVERARRGWDFAHCMNTIGEGYAWPSITVHSDGMRIIFSSEPSRQVNMVLFQYMGSAGHEVIPAGEMEAAINEFVENILDRLNGNALNYSNLHRLWADLQEERDNPNITRFRRLEAQLGYDPDESDEDLIFRSLADAKELGEEAWGEVAADAGFRGTPGQMISAQEAFGAAKQNRPNANANDVIQLCRDISLPQPGEEAAWRVGTYVAKEIRNQENLSCQPVSSRKLTDYAGTNRDVISNKDMSVPEFSFSLDQKNGASHVSLRSKWETGRRFQLARLIGDRLIGSRSTYADERLLPATRTSSYRQQMQRAFAAEFLSPFASVDDMLAGDYSEENQSMVAAHFEVSPMTVQTQLVNHGRIDLQDAPDVANRGALLQSQSLF